MSDTRPLHFPPSSGTLDRALGVVRFLREHCPWDRAQTPRSLVPYLLEEAAETAAAVRAGDRDGLRDELGDLLLNLAFQVVIAEEEGAFNAESVMEGLEAKMKRRHPNLFRGGTPRPWAEIKAEERAERRGGGAREEAAEQGGEGRREEEEAREGAEDAAHDGGKGPSALDPVPPGLEPLARAWRLQARAAEVGFDWPDPRGPLAKLGEEMAEVEEALAAGDEAALRDEVGDLLFTVVNLARHLGVRPDTALDQANAKFERRFRAMEGGGSDLRALGLEALEARWTRAKAEEDPSPLSTPDPAPPGSGGGARREAGPGSRPPGPPGAPRSPG